MNWRRGSSDARLKRVARFGSLIAVFVVGFASVSTGLHFVMSRTGLFDRETTMSKPRQAAEQRADVIFVGPSHLATGIIPEIFDAELSRYIKAHSYNMAIGGLTVPEIDFLLTRLFAMDAGGVKYVIFYPGFMLTDVARTTTTMRSIDYFSISNAVRFWFFLRSKPNTPNPHLDLYDYASNIIVATLRHYSHIGLGLSLLGIAETPFDHPNPLVGDRWSPRGHIALDRALPEDQNSLWLATFKEAKEAGSQFEGPQISDAMFSNVVRIIRPHQPPRRPGHRGAAAEPWAMALR